MSEMVESEHSGDLQGQRRRWQRASSCVGECDHFWTQKEVLKAQYTAAKATSSVDESVAGISTTVGDSGAALQRAQDKIATMQARAGAMDELLQSGVLEDVGGDTDDIQRELDEAGSSADVDSQLAAMKAQIGAGSAPQELTSGSSQAAPE